MCCYNNVREKWIIGLVLVAALFSLGVAVPMILISYPGNECLLFVSVRGQALIYGHAAGCNFISASHCLVVGAALIFFIILVACRRNSAPDTKNPSNGSVRSLRGSIAGQSMASSFGPRAKPTITLIVFSTIMFLFVLITAIVTLSGYAVTCNELNYETRRQIQGKLPIGGSHVNSISHWCYSLFRDQDYHTRFHFDHYELSGEWLGQYTTFRHGTPKTYSGNNHEHLLDMATGLEMCLGCSFIGSTLWAAITVLLILHRKNIKSRVKKDIAESIEDARIWASDMSPVGPNHYEKIGMKNMNQQYESIKNMNQQMMEYPPPPSDASDVDTLLAHQNVIAHTHPDGSYFMTNEGQYVQLVNGVLTHVEFQQSPPPSIVYSQPQFQPNGMLNGVLNPGYPGYAQQQQQPQQMYQQQQQQPQQMYQQQQQPQQMYQQQQPMMTNNMPQQQQMYGGAPQQQQQPQQQQFAGVAQVTSAARPLMASSPMSDPGDHQSEDDNTRMRMRQQRDVATAAGIKCSQF